MTTNCLGQVGTEKYELYVRSSPTSQARRDVSIRLTDHPSNRQNLSYEAITCEEKLYGKTGRQVSFGKNSCPSQPTGYKESRTLNFCLKFCIDCTQDELLIFRSLFGS